MATLYPTAKDDNTTLPNPTAGSSRNSPSLAGGQTNQNDAIKAVETKLGTGSSVAASGKLLRGTGAGTSAWDKDAPTGAIVGTSDIQTLTNKTLTSPTINTPTITNAVISADSITGYTSSSTGTVYGVSITGGKIGTAGIDNLAITTALINNAAVTASKLSTGAAAAYVATSETTASAAYTDLTTTTDTVTVTIGANGLALVSLYSYIGNSSANAYSLVTFAASGSNTIGSSDIYALAYQSYANNAFGKLGNSILLTGLTAGSTTFKMKYRVSAGTGTFSDRRITVVPL